MVNYRNARLSQQQLYSRSACLPFYGRQTASSGSSITWILRLERTSCERGRTTSLEYRLIVAVEQRAGSSKPNPTITHQTTNNKQDKCVSKTDTNPPFAFQIAFPRGTDFTGFLQGGSRSRDLQSEISILIESRIESADSRLQLQC